jgi:DNA processing protein
LLKTIPDPPKKLYWRGTYVPELFENCLAVVGSRKMSPYGEKVVTTIFGKVSQRITVVSGFMYGVDAQAHQEAIKNGLKTIAVMPCGLDYVYPRAHTQLYRNIVASGGLLISEYEGSMGPRTWTYLRRNRIVAGLCRALLVVEASEKSGSLNTAELAHNYSRKVLAVPGNIFSELSKGCLQLIKTYADPVISGYEINEIMNIQNPGLFSDDEVAKNSDTQISGILGALRAYPMTLDDLAILLSVPITILSSKVTQLCIEGTVVENQGRFYAR